MNKEQDHSTRHLLLTMLKTSGALSVADMAKRLGITEMAVRRHLHTMERDGLLSTTLIRQAMGRPTHLYALTEQADQLFPKNYHGLALDLLEELAEESADDTIGQLFDRRKNKLIRRYAERMQSGDLLGKVEALTAIQHDNGYMSTWEHGEAQGEYILDEFNCPISQIASKYNHACQSELELFEELLGADVERIECIAKEGRRCRYMIRERS